MSPLPKRKLCWNCEGAIGLQERDCSFCGVAQQPVDSGNKSGHPWESIQPLYRVEPLAEEESLPPPLYRGDEAEVSVAAEEDPKRIIGQAWSILKPLLLLLFGLSLLLFGLVLFLFGKEGHFTLQWRADRWYFYLLFALPTLWAGYRAFTTLPLSPLVTSWPPSSAFCRNEAEEGKADLDSGEPTTPSFPLHLDK